MTKRQPKADPARCDVPGCGMFADDVTDGTEPDVQGLGRVALPNLNICGRHTNWPHSDDARAWVADPANAAKYKARG